MVSENTKMRKEEILNVAEDHMRQGGFKAVSFRDIAAAVGIKSSSVHYHYPHKQDLGEAVVARYGDQFLAALGSPSLKEDTPVQRIEKLGMAYLNSLRDKGTICLGCILGSESGNLPMEVNATVQKFFDQLINWTATALENTEDSKDHARFIIGSYQGAMALSVTLHDPEILAKTIIRVCKSVA